MNDNKDNSDKKLTDGLKEIEAIKMSPIEKERMLQAIFNSHPRRASVPSPFAPHFFFVIFNKKRLVYSASVLCLVVMLTGGAVFASQDSLPGNALYPLKVKFIEPVKGAFTFSNLAKIEYESDLATERLVEAGILASEGKLDASNKVELNSLLENHTTAFNKAVNRFYEDHKKEEGLDPTDRAIVDFQSRMNANAQVLAIILGPTSNSDEQKEDPTETATTPSRAKKKAEGKNKEKKYIKSLIDKTVEDIIYQTNTEKTNETPQAPDNVNNISDEPNPTPVEPSANQINVNPKESSMKIIESTTSVDVGTFLRNGLGI